MYVSVLSALITLIPLQTQQGQREDNPPAVIQATGIGKPPRGRPAAQSRLMARRAAEVVAIRTLAAKVRGLAVDPTKGPGSLTTVSSRSLSDGRVEVTVEVPLTRFGTRDGPPAVGQTAVQARRARIRARLAVEDARIRSFNRRIEVRITEIERRLSASWRAIRRNSDREVSGLE